MAENKISWKDWMPGLRNDQMTLGQVLDTLPGNPPGDIHWLVRLLENPKSRFHLSGAASLFDHDCIHIILGRGLLPQDEAFVIGFTMGCARDIQGWEKVLFKFIAGYFYPKIYRFNKKQLLAYDIGFRCAQGSICTDIHNFNFAGHKDLRLGDLRAILGINRPMLEMAYDAERRMIPSSKESQRLTLLLAPVPALVS